METIKQVEGDLAKQEQNQAAAATGNVSNSSSLAVVVASNTTATGAQESRINPVLHANDNVTATDSAISESDYDSSTLASNTGGNNDGFSLVKEETIEETLDFDQESNPLKLSPGDLIGAVDQFTRKQESDSRLQSEIANSNDDGAQASSDLIASTSNLVNDKQQQSSSASLVAETQPGQTQQNARKPQNLPVANSHLKKPANLASLREEDGDGQAASAQQNAANGTSMVKSLVSASVASEDSELDEKKRKKVGFQKPPPDVWEPSQIMTGVSNVSTIPATITRDYGQHSRTRITLGGGYVRDKSPPLVNPASSEYNDDKPEKPIVPIEKPKLMQSGSSNLEEVSPVIEVPERIVLPVSPMRKHTVQVQSKKPIEFRVDSRCPKEGVTTFEHSTACDKYFYCENGLSAEMTCPNGLMYGTNNIIRDYCVHRWNANCDDKSVPNPISSPGCRWQYGIFNVQGSPKCTPDYYECYDGKFEVKKCSIEGQVYDDRTKSCKFAELIGCADEVLGDFVCPPDDQGNTYWPFPRYFLNDRALIHCVNDKPQIVRCTNDERVDPENLHCVPLSKLSQNAASLSLDARKLSREKKKSTST